MSVEKSAYERIPTVLICIKFIHAQAEDLVTSIEDAAKDELQSLRGGGILTCLCTHVHTHSAV